MDPEIEKGRTMNDEYSYPEIRKELIERLEFMRQESDQAEIQRLRGSMAARHQRVYLTVAAACALVFFAQFI